jgi:hypothetical protein
MKPTSANAILKTWRPCSRSRHQERRRNASSTRYHICHCSHRPWGGGDVAHHLAPASRLMLEHCLDAVHTRMMPDGSSSGGGNRGNISMASLLGKACAKYGAWVLYLLRRVSRNIEMRVAASRLISGMRDPSLTKRDTNLLSGWHPNWSPPTSRFGNYRYARAKLAPMPI